MATITGWGVHLTSTLGRKICAVRSADDKGLGDVVLRQLDVGTFAQLHALNMEETYPFQADSVQGLGLGVRGTYNGGFGEISWASPLCQAGTKDFQLSEGKDVVVEKKMETTM